MPGVSSALASEGLLFSNITQALIALIDFSNIICGVGIMRSVRLLKIHS